MTIDNEDFVQLMDPKAKEPQSGERKWGWIILIVAVLGCGSLVLKYGLINGLGSGQSSQPQSQPATSNSPFN